MVRICGATRRGAQRGNVSLRKPHTAHTTSDVRTVRAASSRRAPQPHQPLAAPVQQPPWVEARSVAQHGTGMALTMVFTVNLATSPGEAEGASRPAAGSQAKRRMAGARASGAAGWRAHACSRWCGQHRVGLPPRRTRLRTASAKSTRWRPIIRVCSSCGGRRSRKMLCAGPLRCRLRATYRAGSCWA